MLKRALCVVYVIMMSCIPAQAFHPENAGHVDSFQCIACNASYYCKNGDRDACPGNSTAILYSDILEECICNPGYLAVGIGPPTRQIPAQLANDFYSPLFPACRHCPTDASFPFPQYPFDSSIR